MMNRQDTETAQATFLALAEKIWRDRPLNPAPGKSFNRSQKFIADTELPALMIHHQEIAGGRSKLEPIFRQAVNYHVLTLIKKVEELSKQVEVILSEATETGEAMAKLGDEVTKLEEQHAYEVRQAEAIWIPGEDKPNLSDLEAIQAQVSKK